MSTVGVATIYSQINTGWVQGMWTAPLIPNPDFVDDPELYKLPPLKYVAFELWQVKAGSIFDNIMVTDSLDEAMQFAKDTWGKNSEAEKAMFEKVQVRALSSQHPHHRCAYICAVLFFIPSSVPPIQLRHVRGRSRWMYAQNRFDARGAQTQPNAFSQVPQWTKDDDAPAVCCDVAPRLPPWLPSVHLLLHILLRRSLLAAAPTGRLQRNNFCPRGRCLAPGGLSCMIWVPMVCSLC